MATGAPYAGQTETENVIPKIEGGRPLATNVLYIIMFLHQMESDKRCADNIAYNPDVVQVTTDWNERATWIDVYRFK